MQGMHSSTEPYPQYCSTYFRKKKKGETSYDPNGLHFIHAITSLKFPFAANFILNLLMLNISLPGDVYLHRCGVFEFRGRGLIEASSQGQPLTNSY